jgi:hypothetical protein
MKQLPIRISDHAVLRYLERVGGFEIEALRKQLCDRIAPVAVEGMESVQIDGHRFLVQQDPRGIVVVTILDGNRVSRELPGRPKRVGP